MASKVQRALEAMKRNSARLREQSEKLVGTAMQAVEVGGTSFAFGYAHGRFQDETGEFGIGGVPYALAAGIGGHVLGFVMGANLSEHMHNIGDGALAQYGAHLGMKLGSESGAAVGARRSRFATGRRTVVGGYNHPMLGGQGVSPTAVGARSYQGWGTAAAFTRARGGVGQ
jgi:hypothetical protein